MACSSGNSMTSNHLQNSGSEGDLQQVMDERKRKRMASNRESARRSRQRKQKHLDDLMGQVDQLKKENNQILPTINHTTQQYLSIEAENSILKAQINELSQRLQSLNDILNYMNTLNGINSSLEDDNLGIDNLGHFGIFNGYFNNFIPNNNSDIFINNNNNPWNLGYLNQPIMASSDVLHY
ncbi:unnamed protein product [Amaranthus hypochondriacus]